jgi:virginiamycin B lyase
MMRFIVAVFLLLLGSGFARADTTVLGGTIASAAEGKMEGVLVSATKADNTITVTVVSDAQGRYRFPGEKLAPGRYALDIRAIGYVLDKPPTVTVAQGKTVQADLRLGKAPDLAAQLTNTEWLESMPGSDTDKRALLECQSCHTVERIVRSTHSADEFVQVLNRMANYANNTTQLHPQQRVVQRTPKADLVRAAAAYLATVNLSAGPHWSYALRTLPRPKGAATHVVITEYHLPRASIAPHDVLRDKDGIIWFSEFGDPAIGAFDPKTGKTTEYPLPGPKPGAPTGTLDLEPDGQGNYWLAMMFQTGLAKFDTHSKTFQLYPIPAALNSDTAQQSMVMPKGVAADGRVWTNMVNRQSVMRMDIATGAFELIDPFAGTPPGKGIEHSPYGMVVDGKNDLYFMDFGDTNIVRIDAKTLDPAIYPTPTPASRPRRGMIDAQGRIWFAEFAGDRIGMFDTKTTKIHEYKLPDPWTSPYDASIDKDGKVWSGAMSSDRVQRLDPKTGAAIEYLLPHQTNIRRIFIDNSTPRPTFWAGNNHHAAIIKLEMTD